MKNLPTTNHHDADNPISFGIIVADTTIPTWFAQSLEQLLALPYVRLNLLIRPDPPTGHSDADTDPAYLGFAPAIRQPQRRRTRLSRFLFGQYARNYLQSPATTPTDCSQKFANIPQINCQTTNTNPATDPFTDELVADIRKHKLDFILAGSIIPREANLLGTARYGIWNFVVSDPDKFRGNPPFFWEFVRNQSVAGAALQRLTPNADTGILLKRGQFKVQLPLARTGQEVFTNMARWPAQVCADIHAGQAGYLDTPPVKFAGPIRRTPGRLTVLNFARKMICSRLRDSRVSESWNVGIIRAPIHTLLNQSKPPTIEWLPKPAPHTFRADPFGLRHNESTYLFYEHFDYRIGNGQIFAAELDDRGQLHEPADLFGAETHWSFPFLFTHDGHHYCVPEGAATNKLTLYRAESLPGKWNPVAVLVDDVMAVDPVIFRHEDRWWLLYTDQRLNSHLSLFAYYADQLEGPWHPHLHAPIKTDVQSAQAAGTPFRHAGVLYRPAQDSSTVYGGRTVINRIVELTPTTFHEEPVAFIEPDPHGPYPDGLHTLSALGDITLVDGKHHPFSWRALLSRFTGRLLRRRRR